MNKFIKLIIAALMIAVGIYMFTDREYGWGFILIFLSIIPILLFFRNEYILLAFWQMRKQNIEGAKKWMNKITRPESQLVRKQMGYYNYMMGITEAQSNVNLAEKYMRKALEYGLSFKHDRAMAKMSLAGAVMEKVENKKPKYCLKKQNNWTHRVCLPIKSK